MTSVLPVISLPTVKSAPFQRLKMIHRQVVAAHLSGFSNGEIDKKLGKWEGFAGSVLRSSVVKPLLEKAYEEFELEMRALIPGAIHVIRRGLASGDMATALKAADMAFKVNQQYEGRGEKTATAEEVIERVLEASGLSGERIRYAERRFIKPVQNSDRREAVNE